MTCQFCSGKIIEKSDDYSRTDNHGNVFHKIMSKCENGCLEEYEYIVVEWDEIQSLNKISRILDPSGRKIYI